MRIMVDSFLSLRISDCIGCGDGITPDAGRRNNWTMVLAIPTYRFMQSPTAADTVSRRPDLPVELTLRS